MKNTRFVDMITGVGLMLLSAFWWIEANKMMKVDVGLGPGGYPKFASSGLFILGLILTIQSVIKGMPKPEGKIDRTAMKRLVIFVAATFLYVWAMNYIGFLLLTPPYLYFACWFFKYSKKLIAAILSIGATAVLYVVFRIIFFVALPEFRFF